MSRFKWPGNILLTPCHYSIGNGAAQTSCHGAVVWALGNAFAILIGTEVRHMNLRPSTLGIVDHMSYLGDGALIDCRGLFRAHRVKNSVRWSHPRAASPHRKTWQHLAHTKPPEPFPGPKTILRKLHFPAKCTTPCQKLGTFVLPPESLQLFSLPSKQPREGQ